MRRLLLLALAAACVAIPPVAVAAPAPAAPRAALADRPVWPLTAQGRWITDAQGRVVIVHGVNVAVRTAPWQAAAAGFGEDDARLLVRGGFSAVRLAVMPAAVMPRPGAVDRGYLDGVRRTVRLLARHGVMTLVELHQDQWGARYLGEGLPGWMTLDDGIAPGPRQRSPRGYLTDPALAQAFKSFWANRAAPGDVGLMDRWTQIAGAVARSLAHEHSLLGYDLMNAPWPGPRWDCGANDGCAGFQRGALARLWRRTVAQVRAVDPDAITWIEPPSLVPISGPLVLPATGDARRSGLAFQANCGLAGVATLQPQKRSCGGLTAAAIDRAAVWSQAADRPALLVGEATTPAGVSRIGLRKIADARMQSWLRWPYANVPARPSDTTPLIWDQRAPATGTNVNRDYLVMAGTPYPRLIAGTPISWSTNRETGEFKVTWTTTLPDGAPAPPDAVSELWLGRLLYSAGFNLALTGARVVRRSADRVVLQALPGAGRVSVTATSAVPLRP